MNNYIVQLEGLNKNIIKEKDKIIQEKNKEIELLKNELKKYNKTQKKDHLSEVQITDHLNSLVY